MNQCFLLLGAILGFISVGAGAFGAHALKQRISSDMLTVFEVGARYQMYHALALILVALVYQQAPDRWMLYSGWFFFFGSLVFSGSLYALALTGIKILGAITPIGGVLLLLGWGCLILRFVRF
jgi:uncharacterized membrane protein YgdD (TMEM256/DUF423 family)